MAALPDKLEFYSWQRSGLFRRAEEKQGRLGSSLALVLRDADTGQSADGKADFTLMSAADVAGLKPGAVRHMAPAPNARDAETTKFVHVDFHEADLPWRYTPRLNDLHLLRPWLVLLVGSAEEIQVAGNVATVQDSVLRAHNLENSHLWAHVQFDGHTTISRLLSPRQLEAQTEYLAVLVPAFNMAGGQRWTVTGAQDPVLRFFEPQGFLPAFHAWRFWTAEAGDFETLAAALHMPPAGQVGKARLHYRRVAGDSLEVRGAITSLQQEDTPQEDLITRVMADLDGLNDPLPDTISLPHYGRPWMPDPDAMLAGWAQQLNDDPRYRGIAGLGVWMGVEAQDALMDAAVQQAGALREAGQHIGHLAFGLFVAGRLWERRLPQDKNERLSILGPMMQRLPAEGGGFVLDRVASAETTLAPAQFSSAAQRILRARSSHTRHLQGGLDRPRALEAANQPVKPAQEPPEGLPLIDSIARQFELPPPADLFELDEAWLEEVLRWLLEETIWPFTFDYRRTREDLRQQGREQDIPIVRSEFAEGLFGELGNRLNDRLVERDLPCEAFDILGAIGWDTHGVGSHTLLEWALDDDAAQRLLLDELRVELRRCMTHRLCPQLTDHIDLEHRFDWCRALVDTLSPGPRQVKRPIHLGPLSDAIYGALDPRAPGAPARLRVCSRIEGLDCTSLAPPEFPIGLDFPTWDLLRQYDKEWLLPGVGKLAKDTITALQTNPKFIDAYMVGINTQFMSEMRWRDLAVMRTCTPLRMFWGQVNYTTGKRQADVEPLAEWTTRPDEPLGSLAHQSIRPDDASNTSGSRLVIAFHTDLFRRYPSTLVYLVRPPDGAGEDAVDALLKQTPELDMPEGHADPELWRNQRKFFGPIFAGKIKPELTFFAFDVKPSELEHYWLVLDEPPAELRFRSDGAQNSPDSAAYAAKILDKPTRVAISGAELKAQGNN